MKTRLIALALAGVFGQAPTAWAMDSAALKSLPGTLTALGLPGLELPAAPAAVRGRITLAMATGGSSGFDYDSLFLRGALVADVWGPTDNFSRRISLKLRTVKDGENLFEMLAVCDVTNASDTYCQKFNIGSSLSVTFPLDDRGGHDGYVHVLRIYPSGSDWWVEFGRPGHEDQMRITMRRLFEARARQALQEGTPQMIGGQSLLVLGQGGSRGALLFFPDDLESRMRSEDYYQMAPALMAEVSMRGPEGGNQRIDGKVPLGMINGNYYYLIYDEDGGYWVPER